MDFSSFFVSGFQITPLGEIASFIFQFSSEIAQFLFPYLLN